MVDVAALCAGMPLVIDRPLLRVWREGDCGVVSLREDIDDDKSVAWRGAVDEHNAAAGDMQLVVLDVHAVVATNSMAMRFKSAMWARGALLRTRQVAIFTGSNHKSGFVIATILRIAGLGNASVVENEAALAATVAAYRRGEPLAGVPLRA